MQAKRIGLTLVGLMMAGALTATAAPIAVSSRVAPSVYVNIGASDATGSDSDSQGATTDPLGPVLAQAGLLVGGASVDAVVDVGATFSGTSAGQVVYERVGFQSSGVSNGGAQLNTGTDFEYVFQTVAPGVLEVSGVLSVLQGTTDAFGLNGVAVTLSSPGGISSWLLDPTGLAGATAFALEAGSQYVLQFKNAANISGSLETRAAFMAGTFDWRITERNVDVPEPGLLAMVGIGLIVARRRRAARG